MPPLLAASKTHTATDRRTVRYVAVTGYSTLYDSLGIWSYKEQIDAHTVSYKVFYFNQDFI